MKQRFQDFSSQRSVLNFRPKINFIEPDQIEEPPAIPSQSEVTIDSIKSDTNQLITDYKNISDLSAAVQQKIDARAQNLTIQLDPVADAHVVAAVQRHFNDPNKTNISYSDYKECLDYINNQSNFSTVNQNDINQAATDPFRTNFGVYNSDSARPELDSTTQSVPPINLSDFQLQQLEKLLELLTPGITKISTEVAVKEIKKVI